MTAVCNSWEEPAPNAADLHWRWSVDLLLARLGPLSLCPPLA